MNKMPITKNGVGKLHEELRLLKNEERPRIIEAIAEARAHGDLKENAEYHAARERQGFVEGRIKTIEACLSNCEMIDVLKIQAGSKVVFGATVRLYDTDKDLEITYQIVGESEADASRNQVSVMSPIARALIGRSEGDEAVVEAPSGRKLYEIVTVEYI